MFFLNFFFAAMFFAVGSFAVQADDYVDPDSFEMTDSSEDCDSCSTIILNLDLPTPSGDDDDDGGGGDDGGDKDGGGSSSGGSSGGGGGGGSSGTIIGGTTVVFTGQFSAIGAKNQIFLTWTNPSSQIFSRSFLYRKEGSALSGRTDSAATLIYEGRSQQFTDTNLKENQIYHYALWACDLYNNYFGPQTASAKTDLIGNSAATTTIEEKKEEQKTANTAGNMERVSLVGVSSAETERITNEESNQLIADPKFAPLDETTYKIYQKIIPLAERTLSQNDKYIIANFIHYGTPTTIINGAGERGGAIASFRNVFGYLPKTEDDWQDVIKIANGRWPTKRNFSAEKKSQDNIFTKIYGRKSDMKNQNDNAAITVMTYGLRPAQRNMNSEKAGILAFKYYYGRNPSSAQDWDIVRAIAYSGAKR